MSCTGSTTRLSTPSVRFVGTTIDVLAIRMPVLAPTQVITEKLNSLNEHHCDFTEPVARGAGGPRTGGLGSRCERTPPKTTSPRHVLFLTDRLGITA